MKRQAANSRIIFAADLPSVEDNVKMLQNIHDLVDIIKVPNQLLLESNLGLLRGFSEKNEIPLFFDMKIADVPHTNASIVKAAMRLGASIVSVHGFIGADGILACVDAANDEIAVLVQLELTSPGSMMFNVAVTLEMAEMARGLEVSAVQAPGNRPERVRQIRQIVGDEIDIVCCGVGSQGGFFRDVIDAGASFAIVGRAIYNSADPRAGVHSMLTS